MPDGNMDFEQSTIKTLKAAGKSVSEGNHRFMDFIEKNTLGYRIPYNQYWYYHSIKTLGQADSLYMKAPKEIENQSVLDIFSGLYKECSVLHDSILSYNKPDTAFNKSVDLIWQQIPNHLSHNLERHWKLGASQINLQALMMGQLSLIQSAINVSGESWGYGFEPVKTSTELFPTAGRPFDAEFYLSSGRQEFMGYYFHCFLNGTEVQNQFGRCFIQTPPLHAGTNTFKIQVRKTNHDPQIDVEREFQITIPPPCPTSN
jgi:hypothetical protein